MPRAKKDPGRCKALTDKGYRCKKDAVDETGMCLHHRELWREKLTGPKTTAGKAASGKSHLKHGVYQTSGMFPEDIAILPELKERVGSLTHEIDMVRTRLARCRRWIEKLEDPSDSFDGFEDDSMVQKRTGAAFVVGEDGEEIMRGGRGELAKTRKKPDFYAMEDRLLGRLGKLETQQKYLVGDVLEDTAESHARKIQALLEGSDSTTGKE